MSTNSRSTLADRVNREPLLTSEQLFDYFAKVQHLLTDCLRTITAASPVIAMTILEIGSEVAAKLQRNRSIFRRRVEYVVVEGKEELKDAAPNPARDQAEFLCQCMDLGRDMALGKDVRDHVENTLISRLLTERFVRAWLHDAEGHEENVWEVTHTFDPKNVLSWPYVEAATQLARHRHEKQLPEAEWYGVVRYVRARVAAIDAIYDRVTTAYARVILKIAKASSIDDDHFLELFQYGYFGLARANSTYDYILNAKFVAVAKWWVRQSILYQMKASSGLIKIAPSLWQHRARMEQARQKILTRKGSATLADVAKETNVTEQYVESVYASVRLAQVGTIDPIVQDTVTEAPETILGDTLDAITRLPARDQVYLALLFGMPEIVQIPEMDTDTVNWHRLRQKTAQRLIVEA